MRWSELDIGDLQQLLAYQRQELEKAKATGRVFLRRASERNIKYIHGLIFAKALTGRFARPQA